MGTNTILGISAYFHDSAAALLRDGRIVAAASEERFTRVKGDARFPRSAVAYCLHEAGVRLEELDAVGYYEKPIRKFARIVESYLGVAPRGFGQFRKSYPLWVAEKVWTDRNLRRELGGYDGELLYGQHHESHAASAFFPSPFEQAAFLTVDGVGEWATATYGVGRGNDIQLLRELRWPDSLGQLYSAFTYYTGFKVNSGEYKVMGLAPYGEPKYVELIYAHLLDLRDDGSFRLNQAYFNYLDGLTMTNERFARLFGGPRREPESNLTQKEMDLACSVQRVCEEVMLRMARTVHQATGQENLCLAGGVALNCVANGRLLREGPFKRLWVQPAAGDAGGALGVAQLIWHRRFNGPRTPGDPGDAMRGGYLGPRFSEDEIRAFLDETGAVYRRLERGELARAIARLLADGKVVGWFSGRMEFGPRALGGRSILADPRNPTMQATVNLKIKFREGFRPFAPSVLRERAAEYFELDAESPYMLLTAPVRRERRIPITEDQQRLWGIDRLNVARSDIPAVTHVDYSARVQTVSHETAPEYYELIRQFEQLTGCAVLLNTSFNVRGEPIVCTPGDAYQCFMRTHLDVLVLETFVLLKDEQQTVSEPGEWRWRFERD